MNAGPPDGKTQDSYWSEYPRPDWEMCLLMCLDTNVFVRHAFSMAHLDSIAELANAFTRVEVILPEVVERECETQFRQKVILPKKSSGLRPPEPDKAFEQWTTRCGTHFKKWRARLRKLARPLPTSDEILRGAFERLMKKVPPCHNRDEMRDAIIWESVLSQQRFERRFLVFLTDNSKDFPFDTNERLRSEASAAGVTCFRTFADLQHWVRPIQIQPWSGEVDFRDWYAQQEFSRYTAERLEDELPEHLCSLTEYYDADPEIFGLDRGTFEVEDGDARLGTACKCVLSEEWEFLVAFSLSADIRVGGRDGIEVSPSGHGQASGRAAITRTLSFHRDGTIVSHDIEVEDIDLELEEEWDPYDHWITSG